jgi:hypothetical protein
MECASECLRRGLGRADGLKCEVRDVADDASDDKLNAARGDEGEGDWRLKIAVDDDDDAAAAAAAAEVEEGERNRGESEVKERGR